MIVKEVVDRIAKCQEKHPERLVPCGEWIEQFADLTGKILQRLTRLISGGRSLDSRTIVAISNAVNGFLDELASVLESLIDCMGCDQGILKGFLKKLKDAGRLIR